jgi:hypothetical protein
MSFKQLIEAIKKRNWSLEKKNKLNHILLQARTRIQLYF